MRSGGPERRTSPPATRLSKRGPLSSEVVTMPSGSEARRWRRRAGQALRRGVAELRRRVGKTLRPMQPVPRPAGRRHRGQGAYDWVLSDAEGGTRTPTGVSPPPPQDGVSTGSTTSASVWRPARNQGWVAPSGSGAGSASASGAEASSDPDPVPVASTGCSWVVAPASG